MNAQTPTSSCGVFLRFLTKLKIRTINTAQEQAFLDAWMDRLETHLGDAVHLAITSLANLADAPDPIAFVGQHLRLRA